jgi:hypothetical protein
MTPGSKRIQMKRSGARKDTFDCIISLEQISSQLLLVLSEQLNSIIKVQLKNFEEPVTITSDTARQLQELNQLIKLREEILEDLLKNKI